MRWRMLALLFLARIGLGLQFQTLPSTSDALIVAFGLDYAGVGLLIGLFMAPGLFLALPAGYLGRRVADKQMITFGLIAVALGGLVSALAENPTGLGYGRLVAGAGFLFTTLYFTKMVADWFDGHEIATAMSILVMSWPFGIAMGQVGHAWLTDAYGWHAPFQFASIYCLIAALAVWVFYRDPIRSTGPATTGNARLTALEWRLILCAAAAWGIFNAAYVIYLTFGPNVLVTAGIPAISAAGILSVGSWIMIGSGAICGQIVDRFGRRDLVLTICMAGAIIALWLLSQPGAALFASLLFGALGIAPAGIIMALAGMALRPEVRAFGMGVFFTIYYAFALAVPPIAGAMLDATGNPLSPIWLAMGMFMTIIPLGLLYTALKSKPRQSYSPQNPA